MPRRHRSARERDAPPLPAAPRLAAPEWALVGWADVRAVTGDKVYRCPGCDHEIRRGVGHLVVVPNDDPGERRHWHTECWRRELRLHRGR
ncbi:MAG TPA: hypothetical protein VID47_00640 [Actinomycetota bacterium]